MYWKLFTIFSKIGAFTLGGGIAMIPLIEREIVHKQKWIDEDEFIDIISIAQGAPGLIAVNVSIFVGHRIGGVKGSIVATLGSILPPFAIILLVAALFTSFKDNQTIQAIFKGIRPAVVSLIIAPAIRFGKRNKPDVIRILLIIAAILLIVIAKISPIWIIVATILGSVIYTAVKTKKTKK